MNPQLLRRQRFGLNPNKDLVAPDEELLDPYALAPPVAEDTLVDEDLPDVMPSPEYQDQEDPVTRYSPYKTEEFDKLRDMEPEDLQRRGPWHQILGGLADMTTVTRGLAPNLMYRNYDDVMNQKSAFERQQEKADLEAKNRGTDLSAGTATYRTDVTAAKNEWDSTVGLEYDARREGLAPVNEIPSALLDPNVPVETINGKQYGTLRDKDVSFSYLEPDDKTGKYVLVVLHKDDTITERPTNITPMQRSNTSGNLNTMIREAEIVRQQLQNPDLTDQQKAKLQSSLTILDNAIGKVKDTEVGFMDERAKASSRYSVVGDEESKRTKTYRQVYRNYELKFPDATPEQLEKLTLDYIHPERREPRPAGFPPSSKTTEDASRIAATLGNRGDFDAGWLATFFPEDKASALENLQQGIQDIRNESENIRNNRPESAAGFLPQLAGNIENLPKNERRNLKDFMDAYTAEFETLIESGDDLWYHPSEGIVVTPKITVEGYGVRSLEEARQELLDSGFIQHRFEGK